MVCPLVGAHFEVYTLPERRVRDRPKTFSEVGIRRGTYGNRRRDEFGYLREMHTARHAEDPHS